MMQQQKDRFGLGALERFSSSFSADFRFGPLNILIVVAVCLAGLVVHLATHEFELEVVLTMLGAAVGLAVLFRLSQVWEAVLILTTLAAFGAYLRHRPDSALLVAAVVVAGLLAPCIQVAYQWERAVILRFGKFRGLRGAPGCFC